jgi:hypothetical protein
MRLPWLYSQQHLLFSVFLLLAICWIFNGLSFTFQW